MPSAPIGGAARRWHAASVPADDDTSRVCGAASISRRDRQLLGGRRHHRRYVSSLVWWRRRHPSARAMTDSERAVTLAAHPPSTRNRRRHRQHGSCDRLILVSMPTALARHGHRALTVPVAAVSPSATTDKALVCMPRPRHAGERLAA